MGDVSPTDEGMGSQVKRWFNVGLYDWIWGNNDFEEWESWKFLTCCKSVLITHLFKQEWDKV